MLTRRPLVDLRSRRGNYATIVALSLTAVLGIGALAIDSAWWSLREHQAEYTADAAAHGAALALDGTDEGVAAAELVAQGLVDRNTSQLWTSHESRSTEVSFGALDESTGEIIPTDDPSEIDSTQVRVTDEAEGLLAGAFLGQASDRELKGQGRANSIVDGAGAVACYLPIAVASCLIEDRWGMGDVDMVTLKLNPAGIDNVGWARVDGNPSASFLVNQIGDCEGDGIVSVGDSIGLGNGVDTPALTTIASEITYSDTSWSSSNWGAMPARVSNSAVPAADFGGTLEGPILVFHDDSYCSSSGGGSWNGDKTVAGFAWGSVYDVVSSGPAARRSIYVRLSTGVEREIGVGNEPGPNYGITGRYQVRLIK